MYAASNSVSYHPPLHTIEVLLNKKGILPIKWWWTRQIDYTYWFWLTNRLHRTSSSRVVFSSAGVWFLPMVLKFTHSGDEQGWDRPVAGCSCGPSDTGDGAPMVVVVTTFSSPLLIVTQWLTSPQGIQNHFKRATPNTTFDNSFNTSFDHLAHHCLSQSFFVLRSLHFPVTVHHSILISQLHNRIFPRIFFQHTIYQTLFFI